MTREEQIKEAARQRANQYDHPSKWSDTYYGFIDGAKWADSHPQWIPVEDELPAEVSEIHHCSTDVLIGYFANGDNYQTTARYNCNEKVWYDADDWGEIDFPTHWMPLPQPPRKED